MALTQLDLNYAITIPGMLRRLDKPLSANTVQALIDEVARLRADHIAFLYKLHAMQAEPMTHDAGNLLARVIQTFKEMP